VKPHEWRWAIRDAPIDTTAKTVAWALDSRMNGGGQCWPSKAQLAADTGLDKRTVDRALGRLELAGFVTVQRGGGRGHPNRYAIKGGADARKGWHRRHVKGGPVPPEVERKKKEVRPPLTADAAAAAAVQVDAAMLTLARSWVANHRPGSASGDALA
jgi:DNA-binding transcriptional MocR family regulator